MSYTILPDADCEAIVNLWITGDLYLALNTDDPGKIGSNEATGIDRILIASADGWTAFDDYVESAGRFVANASALSFGATTVEETYTHASLWSAVTGGTYRGGAELLNPVTVAIGEVVTIPAGDIRMIGTGVGTVV